MDLGPGTQPSTIADVIARMEAISNELAAGDGIACFNRMYLEVTRSVDLNLQQGTFADPAFVSDLDVVFANLYFAAVDGASDPANTIPEAWAPLFGARSTPGIEPIQFALAGMNAHINHDLPIAVVTTCLDLATTPTEDTHHLDYQRIDTLLDAADQSIRESFESPDELDVDRHVAAVANLVDNWSINTARDVAWDTALGLWEVRDRPLAMRLLTDALARTVAIASRSLLVALP
jgi:Family of unknown function (DUF5995)